MPEERDLDRFVDAALGTYADRCLDENLAERILTRLANESAPQQRRAWLPWAAVALPAASACPFWLRNYKTARRAANAGCPTPQPCGHFSPRSAPA